MEFRFQSFLFHSRDALQCEEMYVVSEHTAFVLQISASISLTLWIYLDGEIHVQQACSLWGGWTR